MDINIEIREKQLASLEQFISSSKQGLNNILQTLNWSSEKLKNDESLIPCSLNPHHLVPPKSLQEHLKKCKLKKLGYKVDDDFLSEPINEPQASIYIDNEKKLEILSKVQTGSDNLICGWTGQDPDPMTSDRLLSTYTPYQRLALYDFAKSETTGPPILPEFNVTQITDDNKELTYEEILEQERNAKRRRIKYKTVHTSHKNHTEILRDVIKNQMESYEEWIAEKEGRSLDKSLESIEAARSTTSQNSVHSINSRDSRSHRSRESHTSRSRSQNYGEERSRHRERKSKEYKTDKHSEYREDKHRDYRMRSHEKSRDYRSDKSSEFRDTQALIIKEDKCREFKEGRIQSYKDERYRDYRYDRYVRNDRKRSGERVDRHKSKFDKHS